MRPIQSKKLDVADLEGPGRDVRRVRVDHWRIVYLVSDDAMAVDVVAVRKRPPDDYGDLAVLLGK